MPDNVTNILFPGSIRATRTSNPFIEILNRLKPVEGNAQPFIPLSLGDPTVSGFAKPPDIMEEALIDVIKSHAHDGYKASFGDEKARETVAQYLCKLCWRGIHECLGCRSTSKNNLHVCASNTSTSTGEINLCASKSELPFTLNSEQVVLTCGTMHSIEHLATAMCNPGDVLLIPEPGFPPFRTICDSHGIDWVGYQLAPEREWEIDIPALRELITNIRSPKTPGVKPRRIGGILVVNPSNPCGSNFHPTHVMKILELSTKMDVPIIADEIYAECGYDGFSNTPDHYDSEESLDRKGSFFSFGSAAAIMALQQNGVMGIEAQTEDDALRTKGPCLFIIGSISKSLAAPGFRIGWIAAPRFDKQITNPGNPIQITHRDLHEKETLSFMATANCKPRDSVLMFPSDALHQGIRALSTLMMGPNTLVQGALPRVLIDTDPSYFPKLRAALFHNAQLCNKMASTIPGFSPIRPRAGMFMMIGLSPERLGPLADDMNFCNKLIRMKNVLATPGTLFRKPQYVRISLLAAPKVLEEAFHRISGLINGGP